MGTAIVAGAARRRGASRSGLTIVACLGLMISTCGAFALAQAPWRQAAAYLSTWSWQTAEATVLSVALTREQSRDSVAASELALSVTYRYEAGGALFEGSRASLADRSGIDDRRLKTLYRKLLFARITGKTMPAFYDPADPASAFLDRSVAWKDGLLRAGLGFALILAGFAIASSPLRKFQMPLL